MKVKDEQIIIQFKNAQNKEQAFRLLMNTYQKPLYWHIRRLVVSHESTDDILQECFVKIYFSLDHFKGESKLYTWLYSIATNESLQFLQKEKKRKNINHETNDYAQSTATSQSSPNSEQLLSVLQQAIALLPEKQKLVFNLRYYDDLAYEEIAKILSINVGTCKTNYHYAKDKVTEYIRSHSDEIQMNG